MRFRKLNSRAVRVRSSGGPGSWGGCAEGSARHRCEQAFTYIELLIASSVLLVIAAALVSSNVFGLRISRIVEQQSDARQLKEWVIETLSRDIREADRVEVGAGDFATLLVPTNGAPYVGNGLRLTYVESGATNTLIYYREDAELKQCMNAVWPPSVVVSNVTTEEPFMAVDGVQCATNDLRDLVETDALTNQISRPLVRVWLELSTVGGQPLMVGPNTSFVGDEIVFSAAPRGSGL